MATVHRPVQIKTEHGTYEPKVEMKGGVEFVVVNVRDKVFHKLITGSTGYSSAVVNVLREFMEIQKNSSFARVGITEIPRGDYTVRKVSKKAQSIIDTIAGDGTETLDTVLDGTVSVKMVIDVKPTECFIQLTDEVLSWLVEKVAAIEAQDEPIAPRKIKRTPSAEGNPRLTDGGTEYFDTKRKKYYNRLKDRTTGLDVVVDNTRSDNTRWPLVD